MNDFEKYIHDDLDPAERRTFEARLKDDPAFQAEFLEWQAVSAALTRLRIADKVKEVDAERRIWLQQRLWRKIITGLVLAGLAGLAVFVFWKKNQPDPINEITPQEIPQQQVLDSPVPPDEKSLPPVDPKPIARGPETNRNDGQKPVLRNINPNLDSATNQLIDKLLKATKAHAPNSVRTEENWNKCLDALQTGQYREAKNQVYQLEKKGSPAALEAQWLLGIVLLEEGRTDDALAIFKKLMHNENHRQKDAQTAAEALR